jgi:hypothetical protein
MPSSTTLFSSNRKVQRARPLGGLEQAKAISLASFSPSKIREIAGIARSLRLNTASKRGNFGLGYERERLTVGRSSACLIDTSAIEGRPPPEHIKGCRAITFLEN